LRGRPGCVLPGRGADAASDFPRLLAAIAYGHDIGDEVLRAELLRMRQRIEQERAGKGPLHLRFSPGGLTDLDFMAAWGQLRNGMEDGGLRTTNPPKALTRMSERGEIDPSLLDHYRFLARVSLRLRLLRDNAEDRLVEDDELPLARSLGLTRPQLMAELARRMAEVRAAFIDVLTS
jgi:glutamine synthetase adenylyltransferase